ncbi:hypothetical protein Hanom_Chr10g00966421 [Helianthus anomalus]
MFIHFNSDWVSFSGSGSGKTVNRLSFDVRVKHRSTRVNSSPLGRLSRVRLGTILVRVPFRVRQTSQLVTRVERELR